MSWGLLEEQFGGLDALFVDMINERLTSADRKAMGDAVMGWLKGPCRKMSIPGLQENLTKMEARVATMMESVRFATRDNETVVIADGPGEETLRALAGGTNWFDPCDDIVSIMISALRDS